MWKRFLLALVIVAAAVSGLALMQADTFRVERSALIKAPPEKVFGYLNDFHQWPAWSPWERLDPAMTRAFSGAPRGQGAIYAWSGNDDVGQGRMEIVGSTPPRAVTIRLDFVKPFASRNDMRFVLTPRPDGTVVTWTMSGASPFIMKLVGIFSSVDAMAGPDFEKGLAQLKEAAEAPR
ncbi:polyketide cyclase [Massilia dura]|uniref:Polyketide cyclase n=1 Tax=Pseudoduganella dura TaxID=321982 RepID=A0A6I3XE42_9BURK|nr:SRPBCC family protein [Pseudoduganella dura]MUI15214.1 polyketide cyclase [Pseudoduganella dura]GGY06910.1 potassium-transporting ATPase subunit F [Pseudoduganella dura]